MERKNSAAGFYIEIGFHGVNVIECIFVWVFGLNFGLDDDLKGGILCIRLHLLKMACNTMKNRVIGLWLTVKMQQQFGTGVCTKKFAECC